MSAFRKWWEREHFDPDWIGIFVNPFYHARRGLLRHLKPFLSQVSGDVLDVGCGRKPYQQFASNARKYVGLDIDSSVTRELGVADLFYDGRRFPVEDACFDSVICTQVFEHVFEPEAFLGEVQRVLREGGQLVLSVPFVWDEHEQPRDFGRYTSFGLEAILARRGFEVVEFRKSVSGARALTQLTSGWLYKLTRTRSRVLNLLAQLLLIAPVNVVGMIVSIVVPSHEDFYLDNVVLATRRKSDSANSG